MTEEMNVNDIPVLKEGDIVQAKVEQVDEKSITVTIENAPFNGIVPISELSSLHVEKASDVVAVGDELKLMVTKVEEQNYVLSKRKAAAEEAWNGLEEKFTNGTIIETEVKEVVKGGLVVDIGVRGFIPAPKTVIVCILCSPFYVRARAMILIGVPSKSNASRIRFSKKRI